MKKRACGIALVLAGYIAVSTQAAPRERGPQKNNATKLNPDAILISASEFREKTGKYRQTSSQQLAGMMEEHTIHKRAREAIELADVLIKRQPGNMPLYLMKARNLCYLNEQSTAISVLEEGLKNCRQYRDKAKISDAYREIANNYFEMGEVTKAITFYTKAIETFPRMAEAYHRRSVCYSDQKKFDLAIKDLDKYIELQPNRSRPYLWRAEANVQKGNSKEALSDINKAINASPEKAGEYILYRGDLHVRLKHFKEALADYEALLQKNSQDDTIWLRKGNVLMSLADYSGAYQAYSKTIDLTVDEGAPAYLARAKALDKLGKTKEAAQDRQEAARLQRKRAVDRI